MTPTKSKRGRPKTGVTPTAERQAGSLAELRKSGGSRVPVNMPAETVAQLKGLQAVFATKNRSETVIAAINEAARRLLK